jgi:ferredoxin
MHNPVESFLVGQIVMHKPTGNLCVVQKTCRHHANVKVEHDDGGVTYVSYRYEEFTPEVDEKEWDNRVSHVFHLPSGCTGKFHSTVKRGKNMLVVSSIPSFEQINRCVYWEIADCRPMSSEWLSFARDAISKK